MWHRYVEYLDYSCAMGLCLGSWDAGTRLDTRDMRCYSLPQVRFDGLGLLLGFSDTWSAAHTTLLSAAGEGHLFTPRLQTCIRFMFSLGPCEPTHTCVIRCTPWAS